MLHATKILSYDLHLLQCNAWAMTSWMCGVNTKDQISLQDLLEKIQLDDLEKVFYIAMWNVVILG